LAHLQVFFNLGIRQRPMIGTARQKAKIQLPHRYIISVNALKWQQMATRSATAEARPAIGENPKSEIRKKPEIRNPNRSAAVPEGLCFGRIGNGGNLPEMCLDQTGTRGTRPSQN